MAIYGDGMTSPKRVIVGLVPVVAVAVGCTAPGTSTFAAALPHTAHAWPLVIVQNDAPWYPVGQAVADWGIPVAYGQCNPWASCIHITQTAWLPGNDSGSTVETYGAGPSRVTIQLSYGATTSYGRQLEATCHELGHAFGLGHDETGGCMRPGVDGMHAYPSSAELQELRDLYLF